MKKILIIALLIVGCEEDTLNITETEITHEHDDGITHSHDDEHFTCIWGTNALFFEDNALFSEDGDSVVGSNLPIFCMFQSAYDACGIEVIGTPVDTVYYHAPDSSNAISQCTADAYYDDTEEDYREDARQEAPPGDPLDIEFPYIANFEETSVRIGAPAKYCTCEKIK